MRDPGKSFGGPRGRAAILTALLGLVLLVAASAAAGQGGSNRTAAHAAQAGDAVGFSHAVVVDQQRPGFEPDVKVDSTGNIYTSVPFGFSTTQSFVWSSRDGGNSYQLTPGNIGPGKPSTCVGGGDTDLYVDARDALYFSDLQGLTNISNSMSTDGGAHWTTNCAGAPNTPDDRMWLAGTGSSAHSDLTLYQDFDVVAGSATTGGGNALVETVSTDGTTFQPVINNSPGPDCLGIAVHDCVTGNEGISGNQVVDPSTGNVFIAHTTTENSSGTPGVRVSEGKITPGTPPTPTTATWSESPNLTAQLPFCAGSQASSDGSLSCADSSGNPWAIAGENFATIARDSAGYLYVVFTAGPLDHNPSDPNFGALTAPEQVYVVHSLERATMSDPSKVTWSAPQPITGSGISAGTNTFPWVVAGSDGRVDVAYYHTDEVSEPGVCASGSGTCTLYGAGSLTKAEWSVQLAQSLNAHDASPTYTNSPVSETYVKQGQICTNGIGCSTGGDRSLGDFLQVAIDNTGAALVSYVFDTSADTSAGENSGPEVISRQTSGPSLLASVGSVSQGSGPGSPMGSVTDPTGDAFYSANGTRTPAGDNLDLTGASLANGPNRTLVAKIDVKDLSSLTPSSSAGGPDASWLIRWTVVKPGQTGNGDIYYAGMDNNGGGTPTFFDGDTSAIPPPGNPAEHTKYITYPQTHVLSSSQASYDAKTGVITMHIPLSNVGNPPNGTVLYSATAFSATSTGPQSSTTLFNLIDATTPFELVIGSTSSVGTSPSRPAPLPKSFYRPKPGCPKATGKLTQTGIGPLSLGMTRRRARQILKHVSTRGRKVWDFFCLKPIGIRAAYPSAELLRSVRRSLRGRLRDRIILLSTSDRRYALRGVRPGTRLSRVARRLHVGKPIKIGLNTWYLAPNGKSEAVLKVRHGVIEEVGIADKRFSYNSKVGRKFLRELP